MPCENTFGINILSVPVSCCQAHFLFTRILKILLHKKVFCFFFKKKKTSRLLSNHLLLQVIWLVCWFVSGRSDKVTGKDQAEERIKYSNKNRYSSVISCHISYLHAFLEVDPVRYHFKIVATGFSEIKHTLDSISNRPDLGGGLSSLLLAPSQATCSASSNRSRPVAAPESCQRSAVSVAFSSGHLASSPHGGEGFTALPPGPLTKPQRQFPVS